MPPSNCSVAPSATTVPAVTAPSAVLFEMRNAPPFTVVNPLWVPAPVIAQELDPFFTIAIVPAPSSTPLIEFTSEASAVPPSVRVFAPNVNPVTTPYPTAPEPFAFNVNPPVVPCMPNTRSLLCPIPV